MGPQAGFPLEDLPPLELPASKVSLAGAPALQPCLTLPVDLASIPDFMLPPLALAAETECVCADEAMCAEGPLARLRPAAVPAHRPSEAPVDLGSVPDIEMPELALHDCEDCPCSAYLQRVDSEYTNMGWGALKEEGPDMMFIMEGFNDNEPAEAGDRQGDLRTFSLPDCKVSATLAAAFGLDDTTVGGSTRGSASPNSSARSPSPNAFSPRSWSDEALDMRPSLLLESLFGNTGAECSCESAEPRKPNWPAWKGSRSRTYSGSTVASDSCLSLACHGRIDSNISMGLGAWSRLDSNMSLGNFDRTNSIGTLGGFERPSSRRRTLSPPEICAGCSKGASKGYAPLLQACAGDA